MLGKHLGMFKDKIEHSGGMELQVDARAEIRAFLLEREEKRHAGGND